MPTAFEYDALPGRIVFRDGAASEALGDEVRELGLKRLMVIATERERALADQLCRPIADLVVHVFGNVLPHVPSAVADDARIAAAEHQVDGLLCVGGGSTTGTAKIIALATGLPIIAVPTTYAGSEMTPVWGMTTDGRKETGRSLAVLPKVVIYDPQLVQTLPRELAVASALNAMAHCVESLWTTQRNPMTTMVALEGVRALTRGMLAEDPQVSAAELLYGAYLAGASFAVAGSGLHHKICHALGGAFDLPHAETHAVVLPHVLAFNASAIPDDLPALGRALGSDDAVDGLRAVYEAVGAPRTLSELGLSRVQLDEAVDIVTAKLPIANPRTVHRTDIAQILNDAFEGDAA